MTVPIEVLDLNVRTYNVLKRNGLSTVGAILEKREDELLGLRNFGQWGYEDLLRKLTSRGFWPPTTTTGVPSSPFTPPTLPDASIALAQPFQRDEDSL